MNKEDIQHLSKLARIRLSSDEVDSFSKEISSIVSYVSVIQEIVGEEIGDYSEKLGARYNVFRPDVVTNQQDSYTEDLLKEMPKTQNRYLVVKKILKTETE